MKNLRLQRGVAPLFVLLVAAILGIGLYVLFSSGGVPIPAAPVIPAVPSVDVSVSTDTVSSSEPVHFNGKVLAGLSAPLIAYNDDDYQLAIKTDKKILMHFCANWDPLCKSEFLKMQAAFNDMRTDRVVGFYVHFNDNETGTLEQKLANRLGVHTQNTKVIIENGQRVVLSVESWDKARYISEITKVLQ